MEAFFVSTAVVALAEIGDKTQLLALLLAARYRRPWPIVAGIALATAVNHGAAGALGAWLTGLFDAHTLRWVLGASFLAMAAWMLIPDRLDDTRARTLPLGVFGTTVVLFFVVEMGDKTQIATAALAARYTPLAAVVAGTTLGMLIANVPAVLLGERAAHRLPVRAVHRVAAAVFAVLGIGVLLGVGGA